jgi:hypothetical protein
MLNTAPAEVPPGAGFATVTVAEPAAATSEAAIAALTVVELTYVVARAEPFQSKLESG